MKIKPIQASDRGFALVVTLTLMILLTVVAVGLLTLSSISLRASSQGEAMATAKNNARLALMLAIGELQKSVGPDQRITATSSIVAETVAKPNTAGSWESWDIDVTAGTPGYATEKQNRFGRWLVSSADPNLTMNKDFVTTPWSGKTVELVGENALGGTASPADKSVAGWVPVSKSNKVEGGFAWHVSDEAVKARINLYREPSEGNAAISDKRALLAGHRPNPTVMQGIGGGSLDFLPKDLTTSAFEEAEESSWKAIHLNQADLFASAGKIREFRNDVTPHSLGLLTDVRNGGLKQDLTSIFEFGGSTTSTTLPPPFGQLDKSNRLYETTHGITGVSDPYWSALSTYYNAFRSVVSADTNPTFNQRASSAVKLTDLAPPERFYPGPVIAKIEALFTYVTRDSHGPWREAATGFKYMGHIIYTPLITLHNPYNINISFDRMIVNIRNVPIAFNMYVNDVPQSSTLVPLTEMYVNAGNRREKQFFMEIANWSGPNSGSSTGPVVLKPGQTLVCSPYLDPNLVFGNGAGDTFFDYRNDLTGTEANPVKARPGFYGRGIGFDIDWLTPTHQPWNSNRQPDGNRGVFLIHAADRVHMQYGVKRPTQGLNTSFQVTAKVVVGGRTYDYGGLEFSYRDDRTLGKFFPETYRYPTSGYMNQASTYAPNTEKISNHARAKSFAMFSAYARTTNGGVYETGRRTPTNRAENALRDGRLAGKPYLFHNPARTVVRVDLNSEKPGSHSHELNFQALPGHVDDILETDVTNRTNSLTGNTTVRGIKSGSYLELPTGPMQTIADFRRSNALTSSYLPNFVQPVGNSMVSPLMSTDKVKQRDTGIASYELLDHSVLANHALYDRFYFSTFATLPDAFGRPRTDSGVTLTPDNVFERFLDGKSRLPSQAFLPYMPAGMTTAKAKAELFSGSKPAADAYTKAAEYQLLRGAFNVNSTSVQAWKAVLAAMKGSKAVTLWGKNSLLELVDVDGVPIVPMSLVNGGIAGAAGVDGNKIDNARTNEWNGLRSLSDAQLDALARKIVEQVRSRGPFLSMSEFVNRRIGSDAADTRAGALETAIEESGINNAMFATQVAVTEDDISNPDFYRFNSPLSSTGNPAAGAPGWITQGDLLRVLEPAATVRSDTFVIRVCGEAQNAQGVVTARAFAEAVVQRVPEFVDPSDRPSVNVVEEASASKVNKDFGRRISVVSFRWLSNNEI